MLTLTIQLDTPRGQLVRTGRLWNVTNLAAVSSYDFEFESRKKNAPESRLEGYPRWCESTRGLVARCLALTQNNLHDNAPADWVELRLSIGLRPGGRPTSQPLCTVVLSRSAPGLRVGFLEATGLQGSLEGLEGREIVTDPWSLAEYALRMSAFGRDDIPVARALELPVHRLEGGTAYVDTADIPEPTRTVFLRRMAHSTRPLIAECPGAVYPWDWTDFLEGAR